MGQELAAVALIARDAQAAGLARTDVVTLAVHEANHVTIDSVG
jgi:hypothetical protein